MKCRISEVFNKMYLTILKLEVNKHNFNNFQVLISLKHEIPRITLKNKKIHFSYLTRLPH